MGLHDDPGWFYCQYQREQMDQIVRFAESYPGFFKPCLEIFLSALLRVNVAS